MEKKYDIFISYRREGGYDTAKHLYDLLSRDGYRVSFDIDTLRNGDFDTQLYQRIDSCKDFILIIDQHAFDRTINEKIPKEHDWLRCELSYALKKNKNIIPVFLSGVKGFPQNLPSDISEVKKKNGPEYNRYYFNDFYRVLKTRFLHNRRPFLLRYLYVTIFLLCMIFGTIFFLLSKVSPKKEQDIISFEKARTMLMDSSKLAQDKRKILARNEILKKYSGNYTIVEPGTMKEGITWVYNMELDPINAKCKWIEEDFVHINDSKGFCGTVMQGAEAWEVITFNLHNSLRYAILEMREVDNFYEGENRICKVKLELDSFDNLKMSYIDGNSAPAPLCDEKGEYKNIVTFYRE